jgi:hypothetical protein
MFWEGATNTAGKEPIEALINLWRLTNIVFWIKSTFEEMVTKTCIWPRTFKSTIVASASNTTILLNELVG